MVIDSAAMVREAANSIAASKLVRERTIRNPSPASAATNSPTTAPVMASVRPMRMPPSSGRSDSGTSTYQRHSSHPAPMVLAASISSRSIERELIDAAKTMGAGWLECLWYVEVPLSLRPLLGGIRMGLTLAMTGAVVGEFVAADAGLGFLMVLSRTNFDAAMLFAASLTMAALSITIYKLVAWLEDILIDW